MRTLLATALLLASAIASAQDTPKPLSVALEPLGDRGDAVVARVYFRFANPRAITEAGLFLDGSFTEAGQVPRNFRFAVPRKDDKLIWSNTFMRNEKTIRSSRWAVLPDQRNEMAVVRTFAEGKTEIEVRLILETDDGRGPLLIAKATETFTVTKTNRPLAADASDDEPNGKETAAPDEAGAVAIRALRRNAASSLYLVTVDVLPPVKRVEFRVDDKKILSRKAPPYTADIDLGDSPERVALHAIGFDAAGRFVDADAYVMKPSDTPVVKITRVVTSDGFTHFKLSVRNPKRTRLKSVALYAGDRKLYEWDQPPYALSVSTASLADVEFVRASVIDESGFEAKDQGRANDRALK